MFRMKAWGLSIAAAVMLFALCGFAQATTRRNSSMKMVLDSGNIIIRIPESAAVTKRQVNFETDEYTVVRRSDGAKLLHIIAGGGAYDLRQYKGICLNHKRAWRLASPRGTEIVVGNPGVNAVSATYEDLSPADARIARGVMASIEFHDGRSCHLTERARKHGLRRE